MIIMETFFSVCKEQHVTDLLSFVCPKLYVPMYTSGKEQIFKARSNSSLARLFLETKRQAIVIARLSVSLLSCESFTKKELYMQM